MNEGLRPLLFLCTMGVVDVLLLIAVGCLATLGWAAWERRAEAAQAVLVRAPARSLVLGLLDVLGSVVLVMVLHRVAPGLGRLLGLGLLLLVVGLALIGVPALTAALGERVLTLADRAGGRALATWVGTATLVGAALFPWVGQAVFILCLLAAVGAAAMAALRQS